MKFPNLPPSMKFLTNPFFAKGAATVGFLIGGTAVIKVCREMDFLAKKSKTEMSPEEAEKILKRHKVSKEEIQAEIDKEVNDVIPKDILEKQRKRDFNKWEQVRVPRTAFELEQMKKVKSNIKENIENEMKKDKKKPEKEDILPSMPLNDNIVTGLEKGINDYLERSDKFCTLAYGAKKNHKGSDKELLELMNVLHGGAIMLVNEGSNMARMVVKFKSAESESEELKNKIKKLHLTVSKQNIKVRDIRDFLFEELAEVQADMAQKRRR